MLKFIRGQSDEIKSLSIVLEVGEMSWSAEKFRLAKNTIMFFHTEMVPDDSQMNFLPYYDSNEGFKH